MLHRSIVVTLLTLSLTLLGCIRSDPPAAGTNSKELRKVRLALNWFPEAEHGGFYEAKLKGYFAEEGLDVEIMPGGPGAPVIPQVARGAVEFGIASADQIPLGRAEEAKVVGIMAPLDKSPRCFLVHAESGIQSLEELQDCTLAMSSGRAFAVYLQKHVPLTNVRIVPYDGSITAFLRDPNFAQQGYEFSEPFLATEQGAKVRVLPIRDIGFNPYASVLFTSDKLKKEDSDLVAAMTKASIRGWKDYLNDPVEVNKHLQSLNPELSPGVLQFGVEAIKKLTIVNEESFGHMTLERWQTLIGQLEEIGLLKKDAVKPEACFQEAS